MKNKLRQFRYFTITEYEKEQEYLREQHKKGWKLQKVYLPGIYIFEACEPEDVIYQLDYNQEGIAHKEEYAQMFQDCGWEYLFDFVGYSYFRKPAEKMDGEEEIFCDDASRLEMMKRVFRGRMIPLLVILFLGIIPQIIFQASIWGLMSPFPIIFMALLILYVIIFIQYGIEYHKFQKRV